MPTVPTATTATAATATLANELMGGNLHGTREARRCGIEGSAARTVPSTAAGALSGSASSQSATRGSKSGSV